jgi:hypothetical protein
MLHRHVFPLPLVGAWAFLLLLAGSIPAQEPTTVRGTGPATPEALVERLSNAWFARDLGSYISLWDLGSSEARGAEMEAARAAFTAEETQLRILGRPRAAGAGRLVVDAQIFSVNEPRGRLEYWQLYLERRGAHWSIVERRSGADVEGLVHLPLGPRAWRVQGVLLRLEDFVLRMEDGTLFSTPEDVGPTALVFVGRGRVHFSPRPAAEAEQLRQFTGSTELDREVKWSFIRLHPNDFGKVLDTTRLAPDPRGERRREEAIKRWSERAEHSFMIDADLPRSPWWLYPGEGDALVEFPWKGGSVLTYAVARGEAEDINLFDRERRLRICSYPSASRPARPRGAPAGIVDVLHHDLSVRFEPSRRALSAVDTLRLRLSRPAPTLRLKLHDDFEVSSVSLADGGKLFFFRVREQSSIVISLGPRIGSLDELSLTVRYAGRHDPISIEHELLQLFPEPQPPYMGNALLNDRPIVYSNRTAWYPQPAEQDYATLTARFDAPEGRLAVTGGELLSTRTFEGRTAATYQLREPGKYFSVAVGRFESLGALELGSQVVRGFGAPRTTSETRENMVTAEEILAFYGERFGPCPYSFVNHVVAEATVPGGHSPPGLVYLQRRPAILVRQRLPEDPANFRDWEGFLLAHELAHQWWGQGVGPASYRDEWLSEAWAQYSAVLWALHSEGEDAFREMLDQMAHWARRYDGEGPIHLGRRLGHLKGDPRIRRAIVYDKGALALHMLRRLLGDGAFFKAARTFMERHRYGRATTEDLRAVLEETSGRDLQPYFESWIYGTGLPTLYWTSRERELANGFEVTVQVRPENLPGPLPLEIRAGTGDERQVRRVALGPEGGSWTITSPRSLRHVEINGDLGILAEVKEVRRLPPLPQR